MHPFLNLVKAYTFVYSILLSLATSIILVDTLTDFAEKIINNPWLLFITALIFSIFLFIAYRWEVWKNEI